MCNSVVQVIEVVVCSNSARSSETRIGTFARRKEKHLFEIVPFVLSKIDRRSKIHFLRRRVPNRPAIVRLFIVAANIEQRGIGAAPIAVFVSLKREFSKLTHDKFASFFKPRPLITLRGSWSRESLKAALFPIGTQLQRQPLDGTW